MAGGDITKDDTVLQTWFERDRRHVCLSRRTAEGDAGDTIVEWWDGAVTEAVDDGFLDSRDFHGSAFGYARDHGLLTPGARPVTVQETPMGLVMASEGKGVYIGWRSGGAPIWSSEATPEEAARGAYRFDSEDEARGMLDGLDEDIDVPVDLSFVEAELDVVAPGMRLPSRASLASCEAAGVVLPGAAPTP